MDSDKTTSRDAKCKDVLVLRTLGFTEPDNPEAVVCLQAGTELYVKGHLRDNLSVFIDATATFQRDGTPPLDRLVLSGGQSLPLILFAIGTTVLILQLPPQTHKLPKSSRSSHQS
jgi:hypothetical protein